MTLRTAATRSGPVRGAAGGPAKPAIDRRSSPPSFHLEGRQEEMASVQMPLLAPRAEPHYLESPQAIADHLREFRWHGRATSVFPTTIAGGAGTNAVETFVNEFWTSRQRAAHSLHEVSYRACFKPQLPSFFIERLTRTGDAVYDPFMGRGTTLLEAALLGQGPHRLRHQSAQQDSRRTPVTPA